jgi:tetratricopeptide (TPR) repeat protein
MIDMHTWGKWVAAFALVAVVAGAIAVPYTGQGRRAVRYTQRRLGWGEAGRQAKVAELAARAQAEFQTRYRDKQVDFGRAEYPGKAALLAYRPEVIAAAGAALRQTGGGPPATAFWFDLLLTLDPGAARGVLQQALESGDLVWRDDLMPIITAAFPEAGLKDLVLDVRGYARETLLRGLGAKADEPYLERYLLAQPDRPVDRAVLGRPDGWQAALAVYPELGTNARRSIVSMLPHQPGGGTPDWQSWLGREPDPGVRQTMLVLMGDLPGLVAAIEQDGMFPNPYLHWELERRLAEEFPDSFLARGVRAYEAVRNQPYFEWDRKVGNDFEWEYGNRFYNPDREIPGWGAFLKEFPKHEGADDAAYRLGRCYEIKGQYAEALRWLYAATTMGDQEYLEHGRGRIIWILDALMSEDAVRALPVASLPADLQPAVAYTAALKELRRGKYPAAVRDLDAVLRQWDRSPVMVGFWQDYPFWNRVRAQRDQADKLAQLAARNTPESRYEAASLMYHDEFAFYNHLWGGGRQAYMFEAKNALDGDMDPVYSRWMAESNNLIQAQAAFGQLQKAPGPVAEKAAYSRAMALLQLTRFGWDVPLYRPISEVQVDGESALEQFVHQYPKSDLAPAALLSLGFLRGDQTLFDRIAKEYPDSAAAQTARDPAALKGRPEPIAEERIPFRYVPKREAPAEVNARAKAGAAQSVTFGEYTYVLVTVAPAGRRVDLTLMDKADGTIAVSANTWPYAGGTSYALARIPATRRPVQFGGIHAH